MIITGVIGQSALENYPLTNLRKSISSTNTKKNDILDKEITFLKSAKDGNIPFCIFEILDNSDDGLRKLKEVKEKIKK